ncbi:hypothetical protein ACTGJ9_006120 [Bradyrhizobium sp. RDM12]
MALKHANGAPKGPYDLSPLGNIPHLLDRISKDSVALEHRIDIRTQLQLFIPVSFFLGLSARGQVNNYFGHWFALSCPGLWSSAELQQDASTGQAQWRVRQQGN